MPARPRPLPSLLGAAATASLKSAWAKVPSWPQRQRVEVKQASDLFWPRFMGSLSHWVFGTSRGDVNYTAEVGDGLISSSVMPVIQWMMRSFPAAELTVERKTAKGWEPIADHDLPTLVGYGNEWYDGTTLWMATVYDWCWWGESYWRILRNVAGRPGALVWLPPWSVQPRWPADGSEFISHYDYLPEGTVTERLEREEVIHFRHGIDPRNPRHGLPPLRSVLREIWMDDEASLWVAALLKKMAIPGLIISPDGTAARELGVSLSPDTIDIIKAYISSRFGGEHRGEPLALGYPVKIERLAWSPQEMDLTVVRNTTEERVSAALGIPSAIVGFHSGLESSKVGATMREMSKMAWDNGLIPMQRILGHTLGRHLLPHFETRPERFRLVWDYTEVQALQEDINEKYARVNLAIGGGWLRVDRGKELVGETPEPGDRIYLRGMNLIEVGPDAPVILPPPRPRADEDDDDDPSADEDLPPMNGNGNGARAETRHASSVQRKQSIDDLIAAVIAGNHPPRLRRPPRNLASLVRRLEFEARALETAMTGELLGVFDEMATQAAIVAERILSQKQGPEEIIDAGRITQGLQWLELHRLLGRTYERHYRRVAVSVFTAVGETLGLGVDLPDNIARAIVATGGRRAGLLDLEGRARQNIFEALVMGRSQGEGIEALVRRIRDRVPAGRWRDGQTRARIISRSETRFAQMSSSVWRARDAHIERMMIFDARLGATDAECQQLQGVIVSVAEAESLCASEHPNGTRQAVPVPSLLLEELEEDGQLATL